MLPIYLFFGAIVVFVGYRMLSRWRREGREQHIKGYAFPESIRDKVWKRYPHLTEAQLSSVMAGLREYFQICNTAGKRMVSMPSQVVDVAWHEFILFTRQYQDFCRKGLGRFLHHTPAEAMNSRAAARQGIKTCWRIACIREGLSPREPTALPRLFALDAQLGIADGFHYTPNCKGMQRGEGGATVYCAGHIGCGSCASGCAGGGSSDAGSGCSSCSSGCSGGCGGD